MNDVYVLFCVIFNFRNANGLSKLNILMIVLSGTTSSQGLRRFSTRYPIRQSVISIIESSQRIQIIGLRFPLQDGLYDSSGIENYM